MRKHTHKYIHNLNTPIRMYTQIHTHTHTITCTHTYTQVHVCKSYVINFSIENVKILYLFELQANKCVTL